jgi:hypothetical protein
MASHGDHPCIIGAIGKSWDKNFPMILLTQFLQPFSQA